MALFDWGKKSKLNKIKQELDNFSDTLSGNDQWVYPKLKQGVIYLLSKDSEVETSKYSAQRIAYTMLANLCNTIFVRHRIYPTDDDQNSLINIWKLAIKRLYGFNEMTETEYKDTVEFINMTAAQYKDRSAFVDDRDDMLSNPLFTGQWF